MPAMRARASAVIMISSTMILASTRTAGAGMPAVLGDGLEGPGSLDMLVLLAGAGAEGAAACRGVVRVGWSPRGRRPLGTARAVPGAVPTGEAFRTVAPPARF